MKPTKSWSRKTYRIVCLALMLQIPFLVNSQPVSQTFNASGSYTVPSGFSANVTIEAWGAGGGGGSNTGGARGGGGGGAYASLTTTLSAGSYTVTVGALGSPGVAGGNSSFTTIVVAEGGGSTTNGNGGAGGTIAGSTGTTRIAGTPGANISGSNGGAGGAAANGGAGGSFGGANNGGGGTGVAPGGGGGGHAGPAGSSPGSGSGAAGRVIVTVNLTLPVRIADIKASERQGGVQIEWTSYTEQNLAKYQLERSLNGFAFTLVGETSARNSNTESRYSLLDQNPAPGINYYRIKSIDLDGKPTYSSIVKINLDKSIQDISIYPSLVTTGQVSIQSSTLIKGEYVANVISVSGQKVYSRRFSHNGGAISQTLQLPGGLTAGMYSVQLEANGTKVMSKAFVIQ